ncbi:hypothetical protein BUALT_Bualt01G0063100 [Buddleja alternifolia]|uniref:PTC1-like winged helix-turn-helix domain-containing protein n=1 Tax=Buddleja alternifolia TaxID=168488 RepID=A0AAV6Y5W8_9LAMI|nr:hypothetical protein BUALT_Bualt01G0063100 [Buddleja alternifolia]
MAEQGSMITAAQSPFLGRHHHVLPPPPPDHHTFLPKADDRVKSRMVDNVEVGYLYEIDHIHLPPRTPVQFKSIRVAMVCEKTELSVAVRFPSMESLRAFFSYSTRETHPALDEKFVMGSALAAKVLTRLVPTEVFSKQKNFENFWLIIPSTLDSFKDNANVTHENETYLSDQLKGNGMVRWGIRRQVKYLGRHKEIGVTDINAQISSSSFLSGFEDVQKELWGVFDKKESQKEEVNGDDDDDDGIDGVNGDGEYKEQDEENKEEENEEENGDDHEDDEEEEEKVKVKETNTNLKRKRYAFRHISVKKPKKEKIEKQKQKKCTNRNKTKTRFKEALVLRNPKDRWSAERYKLAEQNLLEVMKAKGATSEKPILRPQLRAEARKKIGDTGLLDHLLKHMAGKLAPGGQERFRRRHNADGAMEYWLESPDLVNIRRDAGVTDPYWVPPPGWKLGDSPTQDPICARELKLLKEDISKIKRDHVELMGTKLQLEEEVGKLRRELTELVSKRRQEENQAIIVTSNPSGTSPNVDQLATSLVSSKSELEKAPLQLEKYKEQLMIISDFVKEVEGKIGILKSNMEQTSRLDSALMAPTQSTANKQEKQMAKEPKYKQQEVQALMATTPKAAETEKAEEKAAKIQRLKSGFRICKPQGTFLWPNMVKDNYCINSSSNKIMVQVEVPTPPSVSSSTASAPPHLPYHHHHHRASPVKPLPERRAVAVTVSSVSQGPSYEDGAKSYSTPTGLMPLMQVSPTSRAMIGYGPMQQNTCCSSSSASSGLRCEVGNWLALSNLKSASDESSHG